MHGSTRTSLVLAALAVTLAVGGPGRAIAQSWAGLHRNTAENGFLAPSQSLIAVVESFPADTTTNARVVVSTDGGQTWSSVPMHKVHVDGNNDVWSADLGRHPEGTDIAYAIEVTGPDGSLWVKDGTNNIEAVVREASAAVRWIGNTATTPSAGSIDPGADLWVNTETEPEGVAAGVEVGVSTNGGADWTLVPMSGDPPAGGRDRWYANLGGFSEGTMVRYFILARNADGEAFWDSNGGADYRVRVNELIRDVYTGKGRHDPGSTAEILVDLYNTGPPFSGVLTVRVTRLGRTVAALDRAVSLPTWSGRTERITWTVPTNDFVGYGIEADLWVDGVLRASRDSALDASSDWTVFPRYGFVSSYYPGEDAGNQARTLAKFHLNALQFYDWKWTHDHLVPYDGGVPADLYTQPDGRVQSFAVVTAKVAAAQSRNIAAMSYSLLYGDSGNDAAPEHLTWAAFETPFATDPAEVRTHEAGYRIWIMDISNPAWRAHILGQFHDAIDKAGFDGVHLDNLGGAWSYRYNSDSGIDEATAFPSFINEARASLRAVHPGARVAHNDVAENYRDAIAGSDADLYYTEVWGRETYREIREGILEARAAGGDKAVVLAAYINRRSWEAMGDPAAPPLPTWINAASARLMAATVFANGGFRIELGDGGEMLVNEYFPLRSPRMHPGLRRAMRGLYDMAVRYQNALVHDPRGAVVDATESARLTSSTHALSTAAESNRIWTVVKRREGALDAISLINLHGVDDAWRNPAATPAPQSGIALRYYPEGRVRTVRLATPDDGLGRAASLPFSRGADGEGVYIDMTVPSLHYWSLLLIEQDPAIRVNGDPGDWVGAPPAAVHDTAIDRGEWIYRGEPGDRRTFAGSTADADITEVRMTADAAHLSFLVRLADLADPAVPAFRLALNCRTGDPGTGHPWVGDASTPEASLGLTEAPQQATHQLMVYTPDGEAPTLRLWSGGSWSIPPSGEARVAVGPDANTVEFRINRADLGLTDTRLVTLSLVSFRGSGRHAGSDATFDSPDGFNDGIDVVGGATGVTANAWVRDLADSRITHHHTVRVTDAGVAPVPEAVTTDPPFPDSCAETVAITYTSAGRVLENTGQVYLHIGHNGWQDVLDPPPAMTRTGPRTWTATTIVPIGAHTIDLVMHDGQGTWDNNGARDWSIPVARCIPDPSDARFEVLSLNDGDAHVAFLQSMTGHLYDLEFRTSLLHGTWIPGNQALPGTGGALHLVLTNTPGGNLFLRSSVAPDPP